MAGQTWSPTRAPFPHPGWVTPQSSPQQTPGSAPGSQFLPQYQITGTTSREHQDMVHRQLPKQKLRPMEPNLLWVEGLLSFTCNQLTSDLQTSPFPHALQHSKPLRKAVASEQSPPAMFYLLRSSVAAAEPELARATSPVRPCPGSVRVGATFSTEAVKKQI